MALDAKTGKELWEVNRGGDLYITNTTGLIVVESVVIAGASCQEAARGCYVTRNDARTGKELWRNTLIPKPGEPGDETWGGMPFDQRWMTELPRDEVEILAAEQAKDSFTLALGREPAAFGLGHVGDSGDRLSAVRRNLGAPQSGGTRGHPNTVSRWWDSLISAPRAV